LRAYLNSGGFLMASPSCSNKDWHRSFLNELELCLPEHSLETIPMTHPIFSMVHQIDRLQDKKGRSVVLQGITINDRLAVVHSPDGLNDVKNAKGCCCCGGNEIRDPEKINVNIFVYAAVY
jgi:prolyl oligopeptidase PreP (S9A serine peptidase family)